MKGFHRLYNICLTKHRKMYILFTYYLNRKITYSDKNCQKGLSHCATFNNLIFWHDEEHSPLQYLFSIVLWQNAMYVETEKRIERRPSWKMVNSDTLPPMANVHHQDSTFHIFIILMMYDIKFNHQNFNETPWLLWIHWQTDTWLWVPQFSADLKEFHEN